MVLQQFFLDELFKWSLVDSRVLDILVNEVTSEDIPRELKSYDLILSIIKRRHKRGQDITIGIIQQDFFDKGIEESVLFERINSVKLGSIDTFLNRMTEYVQQIRAVQLYEDFGEDFRNKDKLDTVKNFINGAKEIENIDFALETVVTVNPFRDSLDIINQDEYDTIEGNNIRLPFFVPDLDRVTQGGIDKKDTVLVILRSGEGKSTILKNFGYNFIRNGFKGIHFQLEGGKVEASMKYNQIITRIPYHLQVKGDTPKKMKPRAIFNDGVRAYINDFRDMVALNQQRIKSLIKQGYFDLEVVSFEELGGTTTSAMESKIDEWVSLHGQDPDFIIIDSVDLISPSGKFGHDSNNVKARIQMASQWIKNQATKRNTRIYASIQTSEVPMEKWNDPDFVITRSYAMGDKNIVNPFSVVISGNSTMAEKKQNIARIYFDKLRHSSARKPVIFVKTNFSSGKYIDIKATIKNFKNFKDD